MSIGIAKMVSGELIIGELYIDGYDRLMRIEKCMGVRLAPPQEQNMLRAGLYPLNPFGPLPTIEGQFIIFHDVDSAPQNMVDQYEKISKQTNIPFKKS